MQRQSYKFILLTILLAKAILGILFVLYGNIHLNPDEAQYWLWSRFLDFGYYSKPPAIAWEIAFGTSLFGSTEIGVRIGGIILSFFLGVATFHLAKASQLSEKKALYSALILSLCPIGILGSFLATTDLGFLLFWILAFKELCISLKENKPPSFIWLGFYIFLGALFKWTMFLIWPVIIVSCFYYPQIRSRKLFWTFLISLSAFLPSLYWNWNHEFATFKHVATQTISSGKGNPVDFFTSQVGLFFPVFFVFLVIAIYKLPKLNRSLRFLTSWAFIFLGVFMSLAFFKKIQANWVIFAYPLAAVSAGYAISRVWFFWGSIISVLLSLFALFLPLIQENTSKIPYSVNPFKSNLGWPKLKEALKQSGYDPQRDALIADRYQTCSIMSFYSEGQKRSYMINLGNRRKNQFSFWPQLEKGAYGYFVLIENRPENELDAVKLKFEKYLAPYFEEINRIDFYPLFSSNGLPLKWAIIFKVKGYTGFEPAQESTY